MTDPRDDTPLRVLHVSQPNAGGVAVYVGQAAGDQRRRGWEVAVACPPGGDLPERCMAAGVPWLNWDAGRAPGPRTLLEALSLRRLVKGFAPDVVHLHSSKAGLAGRLLRRPLGTPTIFQPHGWSWLAATGRLDTLSRLWERAGARWSDALVCVGTGELREGMRAGVRGPYRLVRNGVDRRRFTPADAAARLAARTRLGLEAAVPLAVCIGRLTRQKGQDVLVAAWPGVTARCPSAQLAIVGDGEDLDRLRGERVAGVRFVPAVEDPRDWLSASNLIVLPSRWEGLPLTALEALATGRPLVGTDIPGITEVVRPGLGALVPVEDPAALAEEMAGRLLFPGTAEREGRAAVAASAAYDIGRTVALLAAVTRDVAGFGETPAEALVDARTVAGGPVHGGVTGSGGLGGLDGLEGGVTDGLAETAGGEGGVGAVGGAGAEGAGTAVADAGASGTAGAEGAGAEGAGAEAAGVGVNGPVLGGGGAVTPPNSSR
ncbi:glycosyltransferase involved in cell wall biosynthesis [Actinomadura coerulea]|uniref:Glycosyltransferase involved in cell wall biosynthesis n=1 Tax=Actinomadura coerulea TaxID=46159 RepID=A0A7X0G4F0_9ACTN|nr:glycosyltransferase [Actinomadura coerulea]MBB6399218.1 glycosyltransferase involved in cell wall biosynthesis [Actinomadura coerulea]GGQ24193.1 glycosyl transferase [Actinomadura coerulea]